MANIKHGAYKSLRLAKEGKLPPGNTRIRKALDACEIKLREHYGGFNGVQEVHFSIVLVPHLLFLLEHPMVNDAGELLSDWKWVSNKVENGLKMLAQLAGSEVKKPALSLEEYIDLKQESKSETESR